jgi:tetratricopeptide (TPR) repeat protein
MILLAALRYLSRERHEPAEPAALAPAENGFVSTPEFDLRRATNESLCSPGLLLELGRTAEMRFRSQPIVEAATHAALGHALTSLREWDAAQAQLQQALSLRRTNLAPAHPVIGDTVLALGWVRLQQGRLAEAEALYREVLTAPRFPNQKPAESAPLQAMLEAIQSRRFGAGEMARRHQAAVDSLRRAARESGPWLSAALSPGAVLSLVDDLIQQQSYDEARQVLEAEWEIEKGYVGETSPLALNTARRLADLSGLLGDWPRCLECGQAIRRAGQDDVDVLYASGVAALLAGDAPAYRELCSVMMSRFGTTPVPDTDRAAKLCLLAPDLAPDLPAALRLADMAHALQRAGVADAKTLPWYRLLQGISECRRGRAAESLAGLEPLQADPELRIACLAGYFAALARHRLNQTNEARLALDRANGILDGWLRTGLLGPGPSRLMLVDTDGAIVVRAEAERALFGREVSPKPDAAMLAGTRRRWVHVRDLLQRGQELARNQSWKEAAEAFTKARQDPGFVWPKAVAQLRGLVPQMGVVFVRTGDPREHEEYCRALFANLRTPGLSSEVESAVRFCALRKEVSPELLLQASNLLHGTELENPSVRTSPWRVLARGMVECRAGRLDQALGSLNQVHQLIEEGGRSSDLRCRPMAWVFEIIARHRLGQTADAEALLPEAERSLADLARQANDPWGWADWQALLIGLEEAEKLLGKGIPDRDPKTPGNLLDLSAHYNSALHRNWHGDVTHNNLEALPTGVQALAGTAFDVRGLIALGGTDRPSVPLPLRVSGIPVGRRVRKLHFLHNASGGRPPAGTVVGRYVLHYRDGRSAERPLVLGRDILDWWQQADLLNSDGHATVAWQGNNRKTTGTSSRIQLVKFTWDNPRPNAEVTTLDMLSAGAMAQPFLVAVTVE